MRLLSWLVLIFVSGGLSAASLPDWAQAVMNPAALTWKKQEAVVELLDETALVYARVDFLRSTERAVLQVNKPDDSQVVPREIFRYNQDTSKITSLKLWHHTPGGKTRVLDKRNLYDVASYPSQHFWNAYRTILLSQPADIKAGDILAYEIGYEGSTHPIQTQGWGASSRPLYHGAYTVTPPANGRFYWYGTSNILQSPAIDPATGTHRWVLDKYAPRITGRPTAYHAAPVNVFTTCSAADVPFSNWPEISTEVARLIEPQTVVTPALIKSAQTAIAGKTSRWEKIRALVEMIQADVSYLSMAESRDVLDGYRPQSAEQCLLNRYGDCKDKATLLVSLLRAIGDDGHVLLLYAGNPTRVNRDQPITLFNHAITAIPADADTPAGWPVATHPQLGRFVIVDATTSGHPLGTLPLGDQSGYGLLVMRAGGDLIELPTDVPGGYHGAKVTLTLALGAGGDGQIHFEEIYRGQSAVGLKNFRQKQPKQNLQPALEKRLTVFAPRIEKLKWSQTDDDAAQVTTLTIDCLAPKYANRAGTSLVTLNLPALNFPSTLAPWTTTREGQSWLPLVDFETSIIIELLPGLVLAERLPSLDLHGDGIVVTLTGEQKGNALHLRTTYLQSAGLHTKESYEALRAISRKYLQELKRPIVLKIDETAVSENKVAVR